MTFLLAQAAGFPDWASLGVGVAAVAALAYIIPKMLGALTEQRAAYRELLEREREAHNLQQEATIRQISLQNEALGKMAEAVDRLTDRLDLLVNGKHR